MKSVKKSTVEVEKDCIQLCKVIGKAIGRTLSFKIDKDTGMVRLDHTFSSGSTVNQKFKDITELNIYLRDTWDMFLAGNGWIR